jgi:hypothetical protein
MVVISNEALEWLDRAEQAREVAGQLTDPSARKAVLQVADSFDRLARAAVARAAARKRELDRDPRHRNPVSPHRDIAGEHGSQPLAGRIAPVVPMSR